VVGAVVLIALVEILELAVALRILAVLAGVALRGKHFADVLELVDTGQDVVVLALAAGVRDEIFLVLAEVLAIGSVRVSLAIRFLLAFAE
jgi:hypothetical protein